jgi:lipopolysaccharide export LptBFGC system permease protein LptF
MSSIIELVIGIIFILAFVFALVYMGINLWLHSRTNRKEDDNPARRRRKK